MVKDHHGGILGTTECVKLKLRLLAEDQKVVYIFKQSTVTPKTNEGGEWSPVHKA
jgi:hypothetical protein